MKALIQRVSKAEVQVEGKLVSKIERGILTLLGVEKGDDEAKVAKIVQKICDLRIFEDGEGKMNLSLKDVGGAHLIVSQFTLAGDCGTGRRPSFTGAEIPEIARRFYEMALDASRAYGVRTEGGVFQAHMDVTLTNDGPVTFLVQL